MENKFGSNRTIFTIDSYNIEECLDRVNEMLGLELELDLEDQEIGTDCWQIDKYNKGRDFPKHELEAELLKEGRAYIPAYIIIEYLRVMEELPHEDILYAVGY